MVSIFLWTSFGRLLEHLFLLILSHIKLLVVHLGVVWYAQDFDDILQIGLGNILTMDLDIKKWHQASLPVKLGGLGVRSVKNIAHLAYISSFYKSKSVMDLISPTCTKDNSYYDAQEAEQL